MNKSKLVVGSAALIAAIGLWEGRVLTPYQDIGGIWTVCAGITGLDVIQGKRYSLSECEALETREIIRHQEGVMRCVKVPIGQSTLDALGLFAYNVGVGATCKSTLMRKLNEGDLLGACNELHRWSKVNGNVVRGLQRRRAFEYDWCVQGAK